jgi:aminotransferase in exopolysaccharide biosynthesis
MSEVLDLSAPLLNGNEWRYVKECFTTGWISSAGKYVDRFESDLSSVTGARYAVACASGTAALQVALEVVGVKPGDEVIVPTVTFIAPVNVVTYVNAHPVFMDCDPFYNIDLDKTIEFLTRETRVRSGFTFNRKTHRRISAIIPVHVFGNAVGLDRLIPICRERNIRVIEDAAESLGTVYTQGTHKGRHTGTIGDVGCYSFNGNKIVTTGGGGAVVTKEARFAKKARYLTTQAKDDSVRYIHHHVGYNFRLNNVQAATGVAQLERLDEMKRMKEDHYWAYKGEVDKIPGLRIAEAPPHAASNYWMYAMQVDDEAYGRDRDQLIRLFQGEGIEVRPLWYLNHLQRPYKKCQAYKIERAYRMMEKTLNLPCSAGLRRADIGRVIGLLKKWKR